MHPISVVRSVMLWALLCCLFSGTATAHAAGTDNVGAMVQSFGKCVGGEGRASVLILMDQSQSLRATDAQNLRASAAKDFAEQLKEFAQDTQTDVSLAVAGFDGRYHEGRWMALTDPNMGQAGAEIESVGRQSDGQGTDYVSALQGASKQLAQDDSKCQLLVFFTDGKYDVDGSYGQPGYSDKPDWAAVMQDGRELLCSQRGGPVTTMRKQHVYVASVGLRDPADPAAFGLLRQVTDGSDGCGTPPLDDHWAFLEAADARTLVFELGRVANDNVREQRTDKHGTSIIRFGLDPIITTASVLADAGDPRLKAILVNPSGKTIASSEQPGEFSTKALSVRVAGVAPAITRFRVRADDGENLAGTWQVRFLPKKHERVAAGKITRTNVRIDTDLTPDWTDPVDTMSMGQTTTMKAQVVSRRTGQPVTASDIPGALLSLEYRASSGTSTDVVAPKPLADWAAGVPVELAGMQPGSGRLVFVASMKMRAKPQTQLHDQVRSYPIRVLPPAQYPQVSDQRLLLGGTEAVEGVKSASAAVSVTGPGCVWLDASASALDVYPQGMSDGAVTLAAPTQSQQDCLRVESGQTAALVVSATPTTPGNGAMLGHVAVMTAPLDDSGAPIPVTIPFEGEWVKAVNRGVQFWVLVGALLLGVGIPLGLLLAIRAATAKVRIASPETGDLVYIAKRLGIQPDSIEPAAFDPKEVRRVGDGSVETVRELMVEGVALRAKVLGNPFAVAKVIATSAELDLVSDLSQARGGSVQLPLDLEGHWVGWLDGDQAWVVYFFSNHDIRSDMHDLAMRLNDSLAEHVALFQQPDETMATVSAGGSASTSGDGQWGDWAGTGQSAPAAGDWDDWGGPGDAASTQPGSGTTDGWDDWGSPKP